uniref:UBA domain-containing protein n=1 Tax=Photinus pyralis TaxID=7054 RepID=A0A1Y1KUH5_PHOPY
MGCVKKDLEIIYNLQWKNNPGHVNDKANIVAMCDIPATTLNWETFKSYLLKNSGAGGDDVKVSYVSIDDKEFPIESQLDFQIALYSFRERARQGGIITLKLDCVSHPPQNGAKRLRRNENKTVLMPDFNVSVESEPPEWFKKYMKEFKKEIMDEVTESVVNAVSALKLNSCTTRKAKFESSRRARRNSFCDMNDKELVRSIKLEKKIDSKLDKLEQKTMKIKEKKMALLQNCNQVAWQVVPSFADPDDIDRLVNVTIVGKHEISVQHMWGGEVYQQEWEIINSGEVEWDSDTELRYAWGSEQLKPVAKIVPCPKLKPQEKGTISVYLEMPKKPGQYECYWYFHHEGRRLGRWVGCHFTVDQTPMNVLTEPKESTSLDDYLLPMKFYPAASLPNGKIDNDILLNVHENVENLKTESQGDSLVGCPSETQNQGDSLIGCPSETQSIISIAGSTSSVNSAPSDEFVVVRFPEAEAIEDMNSQNLCIALSDIKVEKIVDAENVTVKTEDDNNNNSMEGTTDLNEHKSKYAYIHYNGQKIPVPKSLLRTDYLENAEDAPEPTNDIPIPPPLLSDNAASHDNSIPPVFAQSFLPNCTSTTDNATFCSTMTNSISEAMSQSALENKSRLFVFPLNRPGFEVVYPPTHPHSLPESVNLQRNESYTSNQVPFSPNQSFYLPDNVVVSPCIGSHVSQCSPHSYSQPAFFLTHPTPDFNHSKCGGQYCQQYANTPKSDSGEAHRQYRTESPHCNVASAPPPPEPNGLHMLPDTLVSGAVNVASSAINTARSVLNMFTRPEQGKWLNGHWIGTDSNSPREKALRTLYDMGFWDRDLNATLLARYNDDIPRVISELLQ